MVGNTLTPILFCPVLLLVKGEVPAAALTLLCLLLVKGEVPTAALTLLCLLLLVKGEVPAAAAAVEGEGKSLNKYGRCFC